MDNKTLVIDYKGKKTWNQAMQRFDLPAGIDTDTVNGSCEESGTNGKPGYWIPRLALIIGCGFMMGNVPLQSTLSVSTATASHAVPETDKIIASSPANPGPATSKPEKGSTDQTGVQDIVQSSTHEQSGKHADFSKVTLTKELALPSRSLETFSVDDDEFNLEGLSDEKNWSTYVVEKNDNIKKIFKKLGAGQQYKELSSISSINKQLKKLTSGDIIRSKFADGALEQFITYTPGEKDSFVITPKEDSYEGEFVSRVIETRQGRATLFIKNSLLYDANKDGIPRKLTDEIIKIFNRDVNLTRDLSDGDRLTIVFEEIYHNGNKIADSDILAAELINKGRAHRAIRYTRADGDTEYFDQNGYDLEKAFKRHALAKYRKISSGFGYRKHPIMKRVRMHTGTDYAASYGTPVIATGNGTIQHIARKGGYGNTVIIDHGHGYTTLYGHLSKFAKGLKPGSKVYLGDVVGYVGSTGWSTGPHLHYEFRVNGEPKNPETVQLPNMLSLNDKERKQFKTNSSSLVRQLDVLQRFAEEKVDISKDFGG